jgi:NAD(P)-dependent dehydrogenase (short-subunit alcohol dehydrogenase family)
MSARRSWPQPALVGVVHLDLAGRRAPLQQQWEKMAAMAVICITGSSDGIGLATARVLVADGHRVLIHARSRGRGRPVLEQLGGEATLVTGNLAQLDEVHRLADQIRANGPVDTLVHNAGVWVRGNTPRTTADGLETTFAVNVLAPHLLTSLLAADLQGRLLWLGSSTAHYGRPDPATLGRPQEPSQAYSDSKACDVALALAWGRRLPRIASAAVDPGWVKTKLASAGAPGDVTSSADTLAYCCTEADLASAPYWKDRAPTPVPRHLQDEALQDAIASACDRLARID